VFTRRVRDEADQTGPRGREKQLASFYNHGPFSSSSPIPRLLPPIRPFVWPKARSVGVVNHMPLRAEGQSLMSRTWSMQNRASLPAEGECVGANGSTGSPPAPMSHHGWCRQSRPPCLQRSARPASELLEAGSFALGRRTLSTCRVSLCIWVLPAIRRCLPKVALAWRLFAVQRRQAQASVWLSSFWLYPQWKPWHGNKLLIAIPPNNVGGGLGPAIDASTPNNRGAARASAWLCSIDISFMFKIGHCHRWGVKMS
jgi:hypothetical protein